VGPVAHSLHGGLNNGLRLSIGKICEPLTRHTSESFQFIACLAAEESCTVFEIGIGEKLSERLARVIGEFREVKMVEISDECDRLTIGTSELETDRRPLAENSGVS
jgi:hypothetical protein